MSAVHSFFTQRREDKKNNISERDTLKHLFGTPQNFSPDSGKYHVAVQGCCHGDLNDIYEACSRHERESGRKIDLLVCCGDFQSVRYPDDLQSMAVPQKFLKMGDFSEYWTPDIEAKPPPKVAPYLTIFVGGNHENSDWLAEESYGGFLAPNIYYLGHSGIIVVDDCICIAGLSGIFKGGDYMRPYPPRPYRLKEGDKRSAYHVRKIEVEKLRFFFQTVPGSSSSFKNVHLVMSHDWPSGITKYGDENALLRIKPYFKDDISHNALGNPNTLSLLRIAKPQYWLSAHLHCKFTAIVTHPPNFSDSNRTTFLALDKCPRSGFVDFVDVDVPQSSARTPNEDWRRRITRHRHWLRILQHTHNSLTQNNCQCLQEQLDNTMSDDMLLAASQALTTSGLLKEMGLAPALPLQKSKDGSDHLLSPASNADESILGWDVDLTPS